MINFKPRLTDEGIRGSKYWYSSTNPLYASGYGMPNCTCYAWGRFWEETPNYIPKLPTYNAGLWFDLAVQAGFYKTGKIPELGAVICFEDLRGGPGHVAIVEELKENGDIVTSNSAYASTFFYLQTLKKSNNYSFPNYRFQGFIYNPNIEDIPVPTEETKTKKFKWVLYTNKIRKMRRC